MFHTVSQFSADRLGHYFPTIRSRLRVVHNGVAPDSSSRSVPEGQQYLIEHGLAADPFILLPRGLAFRKNANLVLDAWPVLRAMHPNVKLVITSHSDEPYRSRANALDGILLAGFVSDEALRSLYQAAQLVWFPSLYEGFGLPVLEAMACGTPVVASNSSSLPEVSGAAAILISPYDHREHIDAMDELLRDSARRTRLRELGMARASQFTWQTSAEKLRQLFTELV